MRRRLIGTFALSLCIIFFLLSVRQTQTSAPLSRQIPGHAVIKPNRELSTKKVAALMETRATPNLVPIILHFSSVLGPTWPIKIFTTADAQRNMTRSLPLQRKVADGTVEFVLLPPSADFAAHSAVSAFLTKRWFWEALLPAEKVLMFQPDSILCSNSNRTVDDFLEYDFVGAPVRKGLGMGYNGGLSIRNVPMILDIIGAADNSSWAADRKLKDTKYKNGPNIDYEDQWFFAKMQERGDAVFPGEEVAGRFAVETIWREKPLGYHQASVWQAGSMKEILEWCPEYKLCTSETYTNH